ncbi:MAG TPA: hypothetical protein PK280_17725 [Planctomycetota bacterium]|nr:hypothetical protein [Planctomycetota bacterium]
MRKAASAASVLTFALLLLSVPVRAGEEAPGGRTVLVPTPGGDAALYLPAGHDPAKSWPLLVYLPGREEDAKDSLAPWTRMADGCGFVVAVPAYSRPTAGRGFGDLVVLGLVRAGVQAGCDPERSAIVGHGAGGYGASAVAVSYPRLVRFMVIVGAVPAPVRQVPLLVERTPKRLVLAGDPAVLDKAREWQKARPDEKTQVAELKDAEKELSAAAVKAATTWLAAEFEFGGRARPAAAAPAPDPKACAAEMRAAGELAGSGAYAGAYVRLLRAARRDPGSAEARTALAAESLVAGRLEEALEWAGEAARIDGRSARARMLSGAALLRLGRAGEAAAELKAAGPAGQAAAEVVAKRLADFRPGGSEAAREQFRGAVESLTDGDFKTAAKRARAAVQAAPAEASCRALAAYAIFNAEGLDAARRGLDDYLAMLPEDVQVRALAAALEATAGREYVRKDQPDRAVVPVGRVLSTGPGSSLLAAMAAKAGLGAEDEKLAADLAGAGANRDVRAALPLLVAKGLKVQVGTGTLDDLREKLAGGYPVLVQLPQGELAGLRENEHYSSGFLRLAVGYDDRAKSVSLLDYGASRPMAVPYGLFDGLWGRLDRWWLTVTPEAAKLPGRPGWLTPLELAAGRALGGDFEAALKLLEPDGDAAAAPDYPSRRRLARGMILWRLGRLEESRRELSALTNGPVEFALQAALVLAAVEEQAGGPQPGRQEKVLEFQRRAWRLDPGNETATLSLAMSLARRAGAEDLAEARELLDDLLRIRPTSIPALLLRYSF